jgi:hypothetical protein
MIPFIKSIKAGKYLAQWCLPTDTATQETEAEGLLEPEVPSPKQNKNKNKQN